MSKVFLTRTRLEQLEDAEDKLHALEAGGVDNWEWYGESLKHYAKRKELKEQIQDIVADICETLVSEVTQPAGSGCGFGFSEEGIDGVTDILTQFIFKHIEESKDGNS